MMPGEIGMRHYALLTGRSCPKSDNAPGQGGEVRKEKQQHRNYSQPRRRLPAYAKPLVDLRRQGMRPESGTVIVRLDRWPRKKRPAKIQWPQVVIPADAQPAELEYGFLRDLEVIVAHWRSVSEPSRLKSLLREILKADPLVLLVLDCEAEPRRFWFVKSLTKGVEVAL